MANSYLYHHGVKGMKWGVRRYENEDGTLTAAGKERYNDYDKKKARKNVDRLYRELDNRKSEIGIKAASAALSGRIAKENYKFVRDFAREGKIMVDAYFKKNYAKESVDVYLRGDKRPVVRLWIQNGEEVAHKYINDLDRVNAEEFLRYCNEN